MKKRWLIPLVLVLVMAISVMGSYAYFTSQNTATSTVTSGTLDILIAASADQNPPADSAFGETATPWSFANIAPGEERSGCLWLMNIGTLGTSRALWNFTTLGTTPGGPGINLAERLEVTHALTTDNWHDYIPEMKTNVAWNPNLDGYITLQEIANYGGDWESDIDPFVAVAPGGKGAICLSFKMINGTPEVDNPYQGQTLTYNALVIAQNPHP